MSRENTKLILVALFCLVVGFGAVPAVAAVINADTVDGKSAVGSGATVTQRKGKLVATSPTTGRLPNNIIATAPDSAKLGGAPAAHYKQLSVNAFGGKLEGAALDSQGVFLFKGALARWSFTLPATHRLQDPILVDVNYVQADPPCDTVFSTSALSMDPGGTALLALDPTLPGGTETGPDPAHLGNVSDVRITIAGGDVGPGASVILALSRASSDVRDTCEATPVISGLLVSY
jgi:hypothetical protein